MKAIPSVLILLFCFFAHAEEDLSQLKPLKARGFFVSESLTPGTLADLQLELELQEGFFAYHDRFRLKITYPEGMQVGELNISPLVQFEDTTGRQKKIKMGVKEKATLKTQVEIPKDIAESRQFSMALTYIACTKKFCLTPRTFDFDVTVKLNPRAPPADEPISSSSYIQKQIENNLLYALILIFFFGLLTSLTPCIYPLIPITLAVLGAKKDRSQMHSFLLSFIYVQGIGLTYAALGVVAAKTGQLFGSAISHPAVVVTMSLIFFTMGLSLLGLFEIQAPAFIRNRAANTQSGGSFLGAFFSGLLAGVIASPCVGPVLVGVLAYIAETQNGTLGFILLYTFAMGFGILIIALGTFSGLANKLPRSGAWMNTVKTILAMALFAMSIYYIWPLAKKILPETSIEQTKNKVAWQKFDPKLVEEAKQKGLPVIIDFYADWCAACVEMDQFTFPKEAVIEKSRQFVMLKVDATEPFEELKEWNAKYRVFGLPTMIFIGPDGEVRGELTLTGFEEAPQFLERMEKALE